jgi:hypothetical protein
MSDQFVQVAPDGAGKKIDVTEVTVGGDQVQRQRVNLSDPTDPDAHAAIVRRGDLTGEEHGVVTQTALLADMAESLKQMGRLLGGALATANDPATGRLRALIDINTAQTLGTVASVTGVTTVTTVATVTTLNQIAGFDARQTKLFDAAQTTWAMQVRARIT